MICLNLGSFKDIIALPHWVNIDILPLGSRLPENVRFIQHDLTQGITFGDGEVELIRASHLLEHLTLEDSHKLLAEMHRVLKPQGIARILVPDMRFIVRMYLMSEMAYFDDIQPRKYVEAKTQGEKLSRIMFSGDYAHMACYDYPMLFEFLGQAGFSQIIRLAPGESTSQQMFEEAVPTDGHAKESLVVEAIK